MYKVQWIATKGKRPVKIQSKEFQDLAGALSLFLKKDDDSYVERVDLVGDKGAYSANRSGRGVFDEIDSHLVFENADEDGS